MPDETFSAFYLRDCQEMASTLGFRLRLIQRVAFGGSDTRSVNLQIDRDFTSTARHEWCIHQIRSYHPAAQIYTASGAQFDEEATRLRLRWFEMKDQDLAHISARAGWILLDECLATDIRSKHHEEMPLGHSRNFYFPGFLLLNHRGHEHSLSVGRGAAFLLNPCGLHTPGNFAGNFSCYDAARRLCGDASVVDRSQRF